MLASELCTSNNLEGPLKPEGQNVHDFSELFEMQQPMRRSAPVHDRRHLELLALTITPDEVVGFRKIAKVLFICFLAKW